LWFDPLILFRHEGRFAIVTNVGWDAVDAGSVGRDGIAGRFHRERWLRVSTTGADADGEVAWFWRPMVGVKVRWNSVEPNRAARR